MKKTLFVCVMLLSISLAFAGTPAPYSYAYTTWPSAVGTGTPIDGWVNYSGGNYTAASSSHNAPNSVKLDATGRHIISPAIDNPDVMKVWLKGQGTSTTGTFKIYAKQGAGAFAEIKNCVFGGSGDIISTWKECVIPLDATYKGMTDVVFKISYDTKVTGNVAVDDFEVTAVTATTEEDAHVLSGGVGAQTTISSLVDTQAEKQIVHTCQIVDDGTGAAGLNTIINSITFVPGNANSVGTFNWTNFIAGAELFDGTNTYTGTISGASVVFTGAPLMTLTDGGAAVDLQLAIWLSTTLPYNADHARLEFVVGPTNFAVDPAGADFASTDTPVESGDLNNEIVIIATGIGITTQPAALIGVNAPFLVRAGFVDVNNGIDEDWPAENMTISVNTGTGNLSRVGGFTVLSASGQSVFNDLLYDKLETGIILQATSTSFAGPALSTPFNTFLAPTITMDSYPLCWDGDVTVDAQPFAVHVSIANWTACANQDAHLKIYEGGDNVWQYTTGLGWSSSGSYSDGSKPVIHIDANGNWSGWTAIKSKGLATFKPRARHTTNTSIQITGANIIGTALDLDAQGGIVYDNNSRATAGNIILARSPSNEILGSYIAEDNGLPQDQTYATVSAGGWCMALCEICDEEVTFESWNPSTWPGNGTPEFADLETICVEGGANVSIDVILPVELLAFTATSSDASVTLNWATASETNSSRFDILRNNELVHQIVAANSPTGSAYAWSDNNVTNGTLYTYSLNVVDLDGNSEEIATTEASPSFNEATVTEYALHQNFPNPFNPETAIAFDLVDGGFVTLSVYNVLGQQVASLVNGTMNAGRHIVNFSATDLPSGLYLYRIEANGFTAQKKMIVMK